MSNVSPAWSGDIPSTEGSLITLARIMIHRDTISTGIGATKEHAIDTGEITDGGELLCLVLAIVTSSVLVDDRLASVLASLGKLLGTATLMS